MKVEMSAVVLDSSNIRFIEYISTKDVKLRKDDKGMLRVEFVNGSTYLYDDVPFQIAVDLLYAESVGQKFNTTIRSSNYSYKKEK